MPRLQGAIARRAAWSFSAQAISSISNFILTISVLAVASRRDFAIFSLCITTFLLVSQLARSASALPLMILYSDREGGHEPVDEHRAVGVAVLVGLAAALALFGLALFNPQAREQFLILGAAVPLLLFQESARHLSFARSTPHIATLSDGLWLTLQVAGSVAAWGLGSATVPVLLAVWAASGAVAGLFAGIRLGLAPGISGSVRWLREHRGLWGKLVVEFAVNSGSFYLLLYGLALLAGIDQLGQLRAAQTLIGPVIVILLAGNALGIPESVRVRRDGRRLRRLCGILSAGLAAAAAAWGVLIYLLLSTLGPALFPNSWETARPLIPMLSVYAAAVGVSTGGGSGLRALGENAWITRNRALSGGLALLAGLPLSQTIGADGVLIALAATESLFAGLAWIHLARSAGGSPEEDGEELESFVPI
jgi:O-antigen/teichoic acid export membrane protein